MLVDLFDPPAPKAAAAVGPGLYVEVLELLDGLEFVLMAMVVGLPVSFPPLGLALVIFFRTLRDPPSSQRPRVFPTFSFSTTYILRFFPSP